MCAGAHAQPLPYAGFFAYFLAGQESKTPNGGCAIIACGDVILRCKITGRVKTLPYNGFTITEL